MIQDQSKLVYAILTAAIGFLLCQKPPKCSICAGIVQRFYLLIKSTIFKTLNLSCVCAMFFFHKTRKEKAPTQSVLLFVCKSGLRLQNILFDRFDNIYIFFLGVVMVQGVLKEFCQNTSIHGLSSIVEAKSSLIKRIAWFVIFVISISYAGIQLKGNVDSKLTLGSIHI